ncbi:hypothetical protein AQUCO_07400032v1 [Aquilegia coerulea]|uniref:serine--tRNA ligase n=1 Tax=Aquilegia coerulea TaxID=218851 RepID=A0A2G5C9G5_AQUCA|nr:hypothetical protein AQUCO_07400032v1 [Aquilegia coerulea]
MLDINLFREEKGGNPELIRESVRRRCKDVGIVDEIIELAKEWRQRKFEWDNLQKDLNKINKEIRDLKLANKDATEKIKYKDENEIERLIAEKRVDKDKAKAELDAKLATVGNLVHDSVPVSIDEENNEVVRSWGEKRMEPNLRNHFDLVKRLGIVDTLKGAHVAGGRGYYLKGKGVLLNQALINFALEFLERRNFEEIYTPFSMKKDIMGRCAQLAQFDKELYKVTSEGDDKSGNDDRYLIATSEQPLCAYHLGDQIQPKDLPLRYAGYSTCFRTEAGSHGGDTLGIYRVHQFEKVEQFCITSPDDNKSWEMLEEMITNSEDFYKELNIPYRVVNIVSGALNDTAAKKYDLEAWFPASQTYRELVSCSNCTDYQSRALDIRYGHTTNKNDQEKKYVHLLNSTLTATQRTICCILENFQREDGIEIPTALQPYTRGQTFLPFPEISDPQQKNAKGKKSKA